MAGNAIDIVWRSDTSSVEAAADKITTLSKRQADAVQRATDRQVADNNRFVQSIQRQVDTFGLSGTAMLQYEAKMRGVSDAATPLIARLNEMKAAQQAINAQAAGGGLKSIEEGAKSAGHATAGMTREVVVLAHELSQGNFKRFGGSLLVLAEYSTKAQAALRLLAGPVGLVIGGVGLMALAMYEGIKASDELRKSLILTGNYAGVTAGGFEKLTHSVSEATGGTLGKAAAALQALISTGEVGPQMLEKMGEATVKLETLSGKSADEIAKDFAKMAEGPTKWAAEANKAYNFLSVPQYDYIKRLEEQGHKEDAEMEVLTRLSDHLGKKIPESLTGLGSALHEGALLWDRFWHSAIHEGAPETIEDKLAAVEKNLRTNFDATGKRVGQNFDTSSTFGGGSKQQLEDQREALLHEQMRKSEQALDAATQARYAKAGIAASDYFSKLQEERKGTDRLKKDLDELQANIQKRVDGGGPASLPQDKDDEAFIRHRDRSFQDKAGERAAKVLDTRYQDRLESLRAEGIKLDEASKNWAKYGKSINDSHLALLNLEIAQGKLQGLSPQKIGTLRGQASADDAKAEAYSQQQEVASWEKKIKVVNEETAALATNARQRAMAQQLAELDASSIDHQSAAYAKLRVEIIAAENAKADSAMLAQMKAYSATIDDEVKKLDAETAAIGMGTLARLQLASALKIEAEARKLKDANPGHDAEIDAQAAIDKAKASSAVATNYNAGRSFDAGSANAFQKYQEDAGNAANYAEKMLSGSFSHIEDALLSFEKTGKLSFTSLFGFMADEFLKNINKMLVASVMGDGSGSGGGMMGGIGGLFGAGGLFGGNAQGIGGNYNSGLTGMGGLFSSIGNLFSGGLSVSSGVGGISGASVGFSSAADSALADAIPLATGTNYVPYDGMAATLHKGEAVVPAAYNPAAGGMGAGHTFDSRVGTINVGQGVSRGEMQAALSQAMGAMEQRQKRLAKQGLTT